MKHYLFVICGFLLLLCSCSPDVPVQPSTPRVLLKTYEYPFRSPTDALDTEARTAVWDEAESLFTGELSLQQQVMFVETEWQALQDHYESALSAADGWEEETRFSSEPGLYQVLAFRNGDYFVAVVGLDAAYAQGGLVPVNIITNLPE